MIHETLPTLTMKKASIGFQDAMSAPMVSATMGDEGSLITASSSPKRKKLLVDGDHVSKPPLKKRRKVKSVRFSDMASVIVRPISDKELKQLWLQPHEYRAIEISRRETLQEWKALLMPSEPTDSLNKTLLPLDEEEHCLRGLEQLLVPQQMIARKMSQMEYRRLLLQEQHFQRCNGFSDPMMLRHLSELYGLEPAHRAHVRALLAD